MFSKILKQLFRNKFTTVVTLLVVVIGGYFGYQAISDNKEAVRYALAAVEKGTIVSSISGTGQISSLDEVNVKSKVSGDVIYVGVESGDEVGAGKTLVMVDITDAEKAIEDAKENLEDSQVELEKLKGITTEVGSIRGIKEKAQADLDKAHENGYNTVSNVFLGLPTVMSGLQTILLGYSFTSTQWNMDYYVNAVLDATGMASWYKTIAYEKYSAARTTYDKNLIDYKETSRYSEEEEIETIIDQTYETVKKISDSVKSAIDLIQYYQDQLTKKGYTPQTLSNTHLSSLNTYTGTTNGYLTNLLSAETTIQSDKESLIETDYTIEDQEKAIKKLEETLEDTQENLANYTIYSPSSGIITEVNIKKGDSVSSGTTIATLISKQKIAEITLNEIDAANIKTGQRATLTFDALPEVSISGRVFKVDAVGQVSQGVVSYGVKIAFDTEAEQVLPGMSVTADIIIDSKQDVLVLPNSAIKSQGNSYYVELVEIPEEMRQQLLANVSGAILPQPPKMQAVETGLSNDLSTEIVSGLKEGDIVVTSTISPNTNQANQTQSTQGFQIPGMSGQTQMRVR